MITSLRNARWVQVSTLVVCCCLTFGCASERLAIPNSEFLGHEIGSKHPSLIRGAARSRNAPDELRLILSEGRVDEVQAFYSQDIRIEELRRRINVCYHKFEQPALRSSEFGLWRVPPEHLVIQLSNNGERPLLIFTQMHKSKDAFH